MTASTCWCPQEGWCPSDHRTGHRLAWHWQDGRVMAGRLIDAGRPVTVWNRTKAKTAPLAARGARVAPDIAALTGCELVFTMVTGPADLEQVTLGEDGLLTAERRPGCW